MTTHLRSEAAGKTANTIDLVTRARLEAKLETLTQDDVILALTNAIRSVRASHTTTGATEWVVTGAYFFAKHATETAIDRRYADLMKERGG